VDKTASKAWLKIGKHFTETNGFMIANLDQALTVKNPTRCNSVSKFLLFLILNEAQHVSVDIPPIIRSLKLQKRTLPDNVQQLHVRQPSTYAKSEAACAVLGS